MEEGLLPQIRTLLLTHLVTSLVTHTHKHTHSARLIQTCESNRDRDMRPKNGYFKKSAVGFFHYDT